MTKILDQYGQPIRTEVLAEPQTARLGALVNRYLEASLNGLTPSRLAAIMADADNGDLVAQHRFFADMENRDAHILGEMSKRKNALTGISWDIVPPRNASAAEKATAAWAKEVLEDAVDPLEDLIVALMEATGHGFACTEIEWRRDGSEWLPAFHPRPQEWFCLDRATRSQLRLADGSIDGQPLQSFGWVWHVPGKAKTGYMGRMGLYRALAFPFLYKAYAIGDFAEFLETYGLPIILGKYFSGASADEKASLLRAVTQLGHDARAIMPQEMSLEVQQVTTSGSGNPHLAMVDWAEKAISKAILGATLTSQADGKSSTNALGNVHNEVRHDIIRSDARMLAATLTRDLVYPLVAINRGMDGGLRRCPHLVFDTGEPEDLSLLAEALPKLSAVMRIPVSWAHEKLRIPVAKDGEPVLGTSPSPEAKGGKPTAALAALSAEPGTPPGPVDEAGSALSTSAAPYSLALINSLHALVEKATDLESLQAALVAAYGDLDTSELAKIMAAAFALAELQGMATVQDEAGQ